MAQKTAPGRASQPWPREGPDPALHPEFDPPNKKARKIKSLFLTKKKVTAHFLTPSPPCATMFCEFMCHNVFNVFGSSHGH